MDTKLILTYFNVIYNGLNSKKTTIQLQLKPEFKNDKPAPKNINDMPLSGSQKEYYEYYLGKDVGHNVWANRKQLCSKNKLIEWYIETFDPVDKDELLNEKIKISSKIKTSLQDHYNSPEALKTKEKYKIRSAKFSKLIGQYNSDKWKNDKQWKDDIMKKRYESGFYENNSILSKQRSADPEFRKKFLAACRTEERRSKISKAAKSMWEDARHNDLDKFYRMLLSQKNKNYVLNGYSMNSIEYQIALILNELNLQWHYEPIIHINSKSYVPDFLINGNIIIECFGDYWHANPLYFNSTEYTHKQRTAESVWNYDKLKISCLESNNYTVLVLWESEILNSIEDCKQKINKII